MFDNSDFSAKRKKIRNFGVTPKHRIDMGMTYLIVGCHAVKCCFEG